MPQVDPKVYFANERTFLKWLHTSVTLGSVATGLLGFSSVESSATESGGLRAVGLVLLAMSIAFCLQAILSFHTRAKLLDSKRSDGFEENTAPMVMAFALTVGFASIYVMSLLKTESHV